MGNFKDKLCFKKNTFIHVLLTSNLLSNDSYIGLIWHEVNIMYLFISYG